MYDNGGGARQLGEYFHEFGKEGAGDVGLALFVSTVEESTTNFSIRDCLFANNSAPFPLTAGISNDEPMPPGDKTLAIGLTRGGDFSLMV